VPVPEPSNFNFNLAPCPLGVPSRVKSTPALEPSINPDAVPLKGQRPVNGLPGVNGKWFGSRAKTPGGSFAQSRRP